jgi:alpha-mannosidase
VEIRLSVPVTGAEEVNLLEDLLHPLDVTDDTIRINLAPFEIKTIRLHTPPRSALNE